MKNIIANRIKRKGFTTDVEAKAYIDIFASKGRITEQDKIELYALVDEVYGE